MKVIELEQGSREWLEFRSDKITATDYAAFMAYKGISKSPFNSSFHQLLYNKKNKVELKSNYYMARGTELEPIIRDRYNLNTFSLYKSLVITNGNRIMASLDGYPDQPDVDGLVVLIEIKSTSRPMEEWDELIEYYKWQVYHQLMVADAYDAIIIMADSQTGDNERHYKLSELMPLLHSYSGSKEWMCNCIEFLDLLDNFDTSTADVQLYIDIDKEIKELEIQKNEVKERLLKEYPNGLISSGMNIVKQSRSTINYKDFIKDIELEVPEKYIKQSESLIIRVKESK